MVPPAWLPYSSLCCFCLSSTEDDEDEEEIVHMGNAIMSFYSALMDLLGCAPEMHVSDECPESSFEDLNREHGRFRRGHFFFCPSHVWMCLSSVPSPASKVVSASGSRFYSFTRMTPGKISVSYDFSEPLVGHICYIFLSQAFKTYTSMWPTWFHGCLCQDTPHGRSFSWWPWC